MCINVNCWTILTNKSSAKGTHIAFGIDIEQQEILSDYKFKLYFGTGTAILKDISKKNSSQEARLIFLFILFLNRL